MTFAKENTHVFTETMTYDCPWCANPIEVSVEIGLLNRRIPGNFRITKVGPRRSKAVEHPCAGPGKLVRRKKSRAKS